MPDSDFLARTRTAYDTLAEPYGEWIGPELAAKPLDRAVLGGFAELMRIDGPGEVADIGCGPGRITAYLTTLGLSVFGVDLSPSMIAIARRTHPELRFSEGSMTALDLPDDSLGGIVAWYSIIHVPDDRLPAVFAEFHRVLMPGGHLQLAFQIGDDVLRRTEVGGYPVRLDFHPRRPEKVAALLQEAGLRMRAQLVREPDETGDFAETSQQAFLLAYKPRDLTAHP